MSMSFLSNDPKSDPSSDPENGQAGGKTAHGETAPAADAALPLNESEIAALRAEFPYFARVDSEKAAGRQAPAYLDSAATSQRPEKVLRAEYEFAAFSNAAVHRGTSVAVGAATGAFEQAREQVAKFIGAGGDYTVVWQAGATDALNTVAGGIAEASLAAAGSGEISARKALAVPGSERFALWPGDEIVVTEDAHHANLIPWQRLAARTGARLRVVPVNEQGTWSLADFAAVLSTRTRVAAFAHVSNVTGCIAQVAEIVAAVRAASAGLAVTVLDACQSVPHIPVNVSELGVDFMAFSGHKMCGPNGIGVLVGRTELLNALPPYRTGGSAITTVNKEIAEFLPAPHRFEAGTQPVSQAVALGAAAEFLGHVGMDRIAATEHALVDRMVTQIAELPGVRLLGPAPGQPRVALAAVDVAGIHAHDVGQVLDTRDVLVRVGHHCAQPLHRALGITASVRASVHATTTAAEVDTFAAGLVAAQKYFGVA
ncbi:MAG: aminotransferase class V-fold PLP-dependent enzyme [Microbacteriaceae bacterium]|nr:aminotransferase class V-fold PLP-dependent enzyme [Microbacteriaceae bacterium]